MNPIAPRPALSNGFRHASRAALTALLDLLYPPLCLGCDDRLAAHDPDALPLCAACTRRLGAPAAGALEGRLARLPGGETTFDAALALWTFDEGGVLQHLQHALKYGDRPALGIAAGRLLGTAWRHAGLPTPDAVVPVPLARARLLERGYNQAERIATGLAGVLGAPVHPDALARTRTTRSQTTLSRARRRHNVQGAFRLGDTPPPLRGRRVLLVDDVLTTGATVQAAAEPLREAGATVDLAVLALARD